MKVEALIVDAFIDSLNVALMIVVPHPTLAPFVGDTEVTVGAVRPGIPAPLSKSLHPVEKTMSRNATTPIRYFFRVRITFASLLLISAQVLRMEYSTSLR